MFRKCVAAALAAALVLLCTACDQNTVQINPTDEDTSADTGIHIQILSVETTEDGTVLHVLWRNDTSYSILYGEAFSLQRWEQDHWVNCPMKENTAFISIGYMLKPGNSVTKPYALNWAFGELSAGHYRFMTSCNVMVEGKDDDCKLSTEFDIAESLDDGGGNDSAAKLYIAGEVVSLSTQQTKIICDLFSGLSYDANNVCNSQPQYQLKLSNGVLYGIHLDEAYVCCDDGQSKLGEKALQALNKIIDWALEETKAK